MMDHDGWFDPDIIIKYILDYNFKVKQTKYELKKQAKRFNYNIYDFYLFIIIYIYQIII